MEYKVVNMQGNEVGTITLDPTIFEAEIDSRAVHAVVRWQRAKRRAGTHATLNLARMSGGGRKPWKQKGTGRARSGSRNSPLWRGGAVIHGPQPRSYEFRMPKATRQRALAACLSEKAANQKLVVVERMESDGKTKSMASSLQTLGLCLGTKGSASALLVMGENGEGSVTRAARNLPTVSLMPTQGVNVYDLTKNDLLIIEKEALMSLLNRFKRKGREAGKEE